MKKNRLLFILCFLFFATLLSCEEEHIYDESIQNTHQTQSPRIDYQELQQAYFQPIDILKFRHSKLFEQIQTLSANSYGENTTISDSLRLDLAIETMIEDTAYYTIPYVDSYGTEFANLYIKETPEAVSGAKLWYTEIHTQDSVYLEVEAQGIVIDESIIQTMSCYFDRIDTVIPCFCNECIQCRREITIIEEICSGGGGDSGLPPAVGDPTTTPVIVPIDDEMCDTLDGDLNGDCFIDDYEGCLLNGEYEVPICVCVGEGNSYEYCIEEDKRRKQCNKIQDIIDEYSDPNEYLSFVRDLKNHQDENFETALFLDNDGEAYGITGVVNDEEVVANLPENDYISDAHNHTLALNSSSIFSTGDLENMGKLEQLNYLKVSKYVSFLATGKGTHYALTINNLTKFQKFFYHPTMIQSYHDGQTQSEMIVALQVRNDLFQTYFGYEIDETTYIEGLIKQRADASKNEDNLKFFLRFLEEADMGVSLFETDENFNTFTPLSLNNNNNIQRHDPCEF